MSKAIESAIFGSLQIPADTVERGCLKHKTVFTSCQYRHGTWSGCPVCADEQTEIENAERKEQERQDMAKKAAALKAKDWQDKMQRCGIPPRFTDRTFANYVAEDQEQQKALEYAMEYASGFDEAPGRCAMFIGTPGTGKTHLAMAIGLDLLEKGKSVLAITVLRAVRRIKDTWGKNSTETESEAVESLVWPDLLILDEVGVQFGSETEKNLLFDVINERYEQRKSTLLISNLNSSEVEKYLGERIIDRMREDGGRCIVFRWKSYRKA